MMIQRVEISGFVERRVEGVRCRMEDWKAGLLLVILLNFHLVVGYEFVASFFREVEGAGADGERSEGEDGEGGGGEGPGG